MLTMFALGVLGGIVYSFSSIVVAIWIGRRIRRAKLLAEWRDVCDIVDQSIAEVDREQAAQAS